MLQFNYFTKYNKKLCYIAEGLSIQILSTDAQIYENI